ncbi:LysR family transcriptional regulator [Kribbella capetownensis]|uniref:LysR family transcriptional regulator n=1 Tax=Kribbella capetownensis TaxID=1572659 RepID=A0A4R0JQD0_9ACTN|nr:LysR family transcriptional regulator [Kribbella capetownensis]
MMWSSVELREVRVFLTLCEEMHFGRTAERLHVSPSRISQVLHDVERKLGGQLVYRTSRSVRLTSLGERFRSRVNGPYAAFATAVEVTRTESRSIDGVVRVGLFSAPAAGPHLKAVIDAFEVPRGVDPHEDAAGSADPERSGRDDSAGLQPAGHAHRPGRACPPNHSVRGAAVRGLDPAHRGADHRPATVAKCAHLEAPFHRRQGTRVRPHRGGGRQGRPRTTRRGRSR